MKHLIVALTLLWSIGATAQNGTPEYMNYATGVQTKIWSALEHCGLLRMSADDPRLPFRQVPANEAVVNRQGRLLAYTHFYFGGAGAAWVFKNPDGGNVHATGVSNDSIKFSTPYAGSVAWANDYYTPAGRFTNFWCRSNQVSQPMFDHCVQERFINVIASQLCRFAR